MERGTPVAFTKHYDALKNYLIVEHDEIHGEYEERKHLEEGEDLPHTRPLVYDEVTSSTGEKYMVPAGHVRDISI